MDRRQIISWMAGGAAAPLAGLARAQGALAKQARFIVGFPAGGVVDFAIRTTTEALIASGQPLSIIENRAGASGNIALEYVARQGAETNSFAVLSNSVLTTNPFVPQLSSKSVDPFKDLVPVAAIADMVLLLAVAPQLGVTTLAVSYTHLTLPTKRIV